MDDVQKIYEQLNSLEQSFGIGMVLFVIFAVIFGLLGWHYLKKYIENTVKSNFNQSLAKFKGDLVQEIGGELLKQKRDIDKEISELKGDIQKEVNLAQLKLIDELSKRIITQKGEIEKDISGLKGDIQKEINLIQLKFIDELGRKLINQKSEIEKEITGLKGEIDKELSLVQSNLKLLTGQKINYLNERRKSLIDLYTSHVDWTNTVMDKSAFNITEQSLDLRRKMIEDMNRVKHTFNITSAVYQIYGRDAVLNQIMKVLLMGTAELQVLKEKQLLGIELLMREKDFINKRMDAAIKNQPEKIEELKTLLKKNSNQVIANEKEFGEQILSKYSEISENQTKATRRIAELIKETYKNKDE